MERGFSKKNIPFPAGSLSRSCIKAGFVVIRAFRLFQFVTCAAPDSPKRRPGAAQNTESNRFALFSDPQCPAHIRVLKRLVQRQTRALDDRIDFR
ncbi:hypothetical protein ACE04B_14655, partial [Rhizobium phaseoli]